MTAYYEQDGITIYHGDCREVLPSIPPVELCVTSPPYNCGMDYGGHDDKMPVVEYFGMIEDCVHAVANALCSGGYLAMNVPSWIGSRGEQVFAFDESKWGGHSEKISDAHYTMTTDESFKRAAQPNAHPALGSSRPQESRKTTTDCVSQVVSTTTGSISVGAVGREIPSKISRKQRRAAVGATMQCRQRLLLRAYTRTGATR